MFENQGEAHFRKLESALVDRLDLSRPVVLATGGGLFADSRLRRRLLENCVTIWLDAPVDQISERLARSAHRPLLDGDNPAPALERMAEARHDAYSAAHLRIDCRNRSPDAVVEAILAAFGSDPANRAWRLQ
jgi:shikimate kinase